MNQPDLPPDRSWVLTEQRNPRSMQLHSLTVPELVRLIRLEDNAVLSAMEAAEHTLNRFIEAVEPRFVAGGRLMYIGAGTSGRLGVLDASEAPPTFQVSPDRIIGIIAGGDGSLRKSSEGKEDDPDGARQALFALNLTNRDTVLGIAAGGTTPYVLGALRITKEISSDILTGMLVCSQIDHPSSADHLMILPTGPEVLTGSTRMKAGTATKLALNTISTTLMIRSGRVYQNLMVDLKASNKKLEDRAARIIQTLTGLDREDAFTLLRRAEGEVKVALVMHLKNQDRETAVRLIDQAGGRLETILDRAY